MAVNLSPRQFQQRELPLVVAATLRDPASTPRDLELEITESMAMQNIDAHERHAAPSARARRQYRDRRFRHRLFVAQLPERFPIDTVKIDQEFVQGIAASADERAIVPAVIAMAHGLRLRVIAEGVETPEQLDLLRQQGCEEVQGFLFGEPAPGDGLSAG